MNIEHVGEGVIALRSETSQEAQDRDARRLHIAELRASGIEPYPAEGWHPSHDLAAVVIEAESFRESGETIRLAGRIMAQRNMGKVVFLDLVDRGVRLQLYLSESVADKASWRSVQSLDLGDFVGVEGHIFTTQRGERSLKLERFEILGKPLRSIPMGKRDKSGVRRQALADTGQLLRNRHIELLVNPKLVERIVQRDLILRELRAYFHDAGFVEIETPILGRAYSGAAATPFVTHSKALETDLYLRVSPECGLKQALCGGITKVFEIGRNFRNEGIDHSHNPEFTAVEWYEAWSDYRDQMTRFENLVARLARTVSDTGIVRFRGRDIDFTPPWPRQCMGELVAEHIGVGADAMTQERMAAFWLEQKLPLPAPATWGGLVVGLFEERVQHTLVGPTFIIDHPIEGSPLTKRHRKDPRLVERFEPYVMGLEIGNAYSELNDPEEQRARLIAQDNGRDDPYGVDEQFIKAIEDGMPQAGGAGLGIDRIVMMLTGGERLSDVLLFPMV